MKKKINKEKKTTSRKLTWIPRTFLSHNISILSSQNQGREWFYWIFRYDVIYFRIANCFPPRQEIKRVSIDFMLAPASLYEFQVLRAFRGVEKIKLRCRKRLANFELKVELGNRGFPGIRSNGWDLLESLQADGVFRHTNQEKVLDLASNKLGALFPSPHEELGI